MKYRQIIERLLEEGLRESWMTTEDWLEITEVLALQMGCIGYEKLLEKLNNELELGVKNGVSIEKQSLMIKNIFSNYFKK